MRRYPGRISHEMALSVLPWMLAWPRSAFMPPPGRPILPSSSWRMAAVRMSWPPVVCETHGVHDRHDLVGTARLADDAGDLEELLGGDARDRRHHVRRVARVVLAEQLEHRAGVLQLHVSLGQRHPGPGAGRPLPVR